MGKLIARRFKRVALFGRPIVLSTEGELKSNDNRDELNERYPRSHILLIQRTTRLFGSQASWQISNWILHYKWRL